MKLIFFFDKIMHRARRATHEEESVEVVRIAQEIKNVNLMLIESTAEDLFEDPLKSMEQSKLWKVKSAYGDIGLKYGDDESIAYVASRMPAVYSACYRVLSEVFKI